MTDSLVHVTGQLSFAKEQSLFRLRVEHCLHNRIQARDGLPLSNLSGNVLCLLSLFCVTQASTIQLRVNMYRF